MIDYLAEQSNFSFSISEVLICAYGTRFITFFLYASFCSSVL